MEEVTVTEAVEMGVEGAAMVAAARAVVAAVKA